MKYTERFLPVDSWIDHCDDLLHKNSYNAKISNMYTGVLCIFVVTSMELAVKDIFIDFASSVHKICKEFVDNHFSRINGHISLEELYSHVRKFGSRYNELFQRILEDAEKKALSNGYSIKESYNSIIKWRHSYIHTPNTIPTTYRELVVSFTYAKIVLDCLHKAMSKK